MPLREIIIKEIYICIQSLKLDEIYILGKLFMRKKILVISEKKFEVTERRGILIFIFHTAVFSILMDAC